MPRTSALLRRALLALRLCLLPLDVIGAAPGGNEHAPLPSLLSQTGLYADASTRAVRPDNLAFSPQYTLWSDGAAKRRWLHIPPGTSIDASNPDLWQFPPGTKLWKEFSHGRRIETRLIERLGSGTWRYATYVWDDDETQARLAPASGMRALPLAALRGARYDVPAEADCRACHEGAVVPVLGASALQLSPDRDPLAPHAEPVRPGDADLRLLVERGWLRKLPQALLDHPPRIAAPTPVARAALGHLHANCGHCHNDSADSAPVDLVLAQGTRANEATNAALMRSLVTTRPRYQAPGLPATAPLVEAGRPESSVLFTRMRSRDARMQMPPLGTRQPDLEALELIERWIHQQPQSTKEHPQ